MKIAPDMSIVKSLLFKHRDHGVVTSDNETVFICPIKGGPLRFLHKLFKGSDETIRELERYLWARLPAPYREFMVDFNGATLFDNTFSIFGICPDFNRGTSLEQQRPISIMDKLEERRLTTGLEGTVASVPVGSIAAATEVFRAEMDRDGTINLLRDNGAVCRFPSFLDFVDSVCVLLDSLSDYRGLLDESGEELENEMIRLIDTDRS